MRCTRTHCLRDATPGYRLCDRCRDRHRDYMRRWRGPRRLSRCDKALAWLSVAPRTTAQLAELLDTSCAMVATLAWQWKQRGLIESAGHGRYRAV